MKQWIINQDGKKEVNIDKKECYQLEGDSNHESKMKRSYIFEETKDERWKTKD